MIDLPPLTIERDEVAEVQLAAAARRQIEADNVARGDGIHASSLLDPLMEYWNRIAPKELSERQIFLFIIGKVLHHLVLQTVGGEGTDAGTREELGIQFSPDHIDNGFPIELKTNRSMMEPAPGHIQEEYGHYLEQLCIYMVLMNVLRGSLWVLHINLRDASGRTFPEPRCYSVEMTQEDFDVVEAQVVAARLRLEEAIRQRTPQILPLCRTWKCGERACPHWKDCRPVGRYPERDKRRWSA